MEMKSYYWSIGDDNVTIEQENDATVITVHRWVMRMKRYYWG